MTQKICITGADGFIGSHLTKLALEEGFDVVGTVRGISHPQKVAHLQDLPHGSTRLKIVEAFLENEDSFVRAFKDCSYVFHVASPCKLTAKNPQKEIVEPAVEGTKNVLKACHKTPSLEKLVITSSITAIFDEPEHRYIYTEADWNELSSLKRNPYYFSKTLAEKIAWKYVEEKNPSFEVVTINPFQVVGPPLKPHLNFSNEFFRTVVHMRMPAVLDMSWGVVDVRDVAKAHLLAAKNTKAKGRYLCSTPVRPMKEHVEFVQQFMVKKKRSIHLTSPFFSSSIKPFTWVIPSEHSNFMRSNLGKKYQIDNTKIHKQLGLDFIPIEKSFRDTLEALARWDLIDRDKLSIN